MDHDLWEPKMSGAWLIRELREQRICPKGVILTSGWQAQTKDVAEALGVAFLPKPATTQEILTLIAAVLAGEAKPPASNPPDEHG